MTTVDFIIQLSNEITNFSDTDLRGVDFSYLRLEGLNFKGANLSGCYFRFTSLSRCNFENANLSGAKMFRTGLSNVNLTNARLDNTSVGMCYYRDIKIDTKTMDKYFPSICPSKGEFVGWKKAVHETDNTPVIVKLLIPSDAKRGSAFGRKCRCDKARVLSIEHADILGKSMGGIAHSIVSEDFKYEPVKEVSVDNFDDDRSHECAPGIHFFMTRKEAVNYLI